MINNDADFSTWIERGEIHSSSRSAETMGRRWHQRPGNEQVAVTEGQDSIVTTIFPPQFSHMFRQLGVAKLGGGPICANSKLVK